MLYLQVLLLSLFFSSYTFAFEVAPGIIIPDDKIKSVSESTAWQKLMHYRVSGFGQLRSEIDGDDYFFAEDGKTNPEKELQASLKALFSNQTMGKLKLPFTCSFPERTRFLATTFGLKVERPYCEILDRFMKQFNDPQSVSLVFSSAYPNNPASMFGHTFLKVNSIRNTDLIDVGINYAAVVADDENGFAFVWFGTTGGYIGQWSTQPYYVKVREYSNFESRDLWEYKISLSKEETLRLLHHIWELEVNSNTEYYFFDENCSYQVLAAIEAIRPEWTLLKQTIYMIPGESVKFLAETEGAVSEVKYRPSLFNRINSRYRSLSSDETKLFHQVVDKKVPVTEVQNRILAEAVITYYDYLKNDRPAFFEKTYAQDLEALRSQRASLGLLTPEEEKRIPEIRGNTRPDLGHDSYSLQTGAGYYSPENSKSASGYFSFKIKSAYHDLLNDDTGYTPYAHIDFPYAEFRYFEKSGKWTVEEIGGISTTSITPVTNLKTPISFRGSLGYRRFELKDDFDLHQVHGEIGGGLSFYFINELNRLYFLMLVGTDLSPDLYRGHSGLIGSELGFLLNPAEKYKLQLSVRSLCDLVYSDKCYGQSELQLNQAWHLSRNHEVRNVNKYKENAEKRGTRTFESNLNYIWFFH